MGSLFIFFLFFFLRMLDSFFFVFFFCFFFVCRGLIKCVAVQPATLAGTSCRNPVRDGFGSGLSRFHPQAQSRINFFIMGGSHQRR